MVGAHEIAEAVERKRGAITSFLQDLLRCPAPAWPDEQPSAPNAQVLVEDKLRSLGLKVEAWYPDLAELESHPEYTEYPADYSQRPCVIGELSGTADGLPAITLCGHADVVGPGRAEAWTFPPHSGELSGGRVHGRGASDARGPLVAYLFALEVFMELVARPHGTVRFVSVGDEEGGGNHALAYVLRGLSGDAVLVGEPTELQVQPGSRGAISFTVRVSGKAAHSGMAYEGQNAVVKAARIVDALDRLQHQLDREHLHPLWRTAPIAHTFNIAQIEGGRFIGVVPDECTIKAVAGCIGGESVAALQQRVIETIAEVAAADPWLTAHPPEITWGPMRFEPSVTEPDHPFVHTLSDAVRQTTGSWPHIGALPGGSDLRAFINVGGVPGAHFGPGVMHLGHGEDEYVELEDVLTAVKVVCRALLEWTTDPLVAPEENSLTSTSDASGRSTDQPLKGGVK